MLALGLSGLAVNGCRYWPEDGFRNPCLRTTLPDHLAGHDLTLAAWEGVAPDAFWDCHVHLLGTGDSGSGIYLNPSMQSLLQPLKLAQFKFYLNAACVEDATQVDNGFLERLMACQDGLPSGNRIMLLGFDYNYSDDGERRPESSAFSIPNDYAARIAQRHPERFEWIASIHPYREDAVEALETAAKNGARAVKWLPPAMGMDPASPRCDRFYGALARLDIPLITHGGEEKAVEGGDSQRYGNPLRLRRALEHGVRVIVAHCASLGIGQDTDRGPDGPEMENFSLFARMMDEPAYEGRLYGEISALTQINRFDPALRTVLERTDWHPRLINGSDYPLPGVLPLFSAKGLATAGFMGEADTEVIAEIRRYNPLLFDFVLKRSLRLNGKALSPRVFESRHIFDNNSGA